MSVLAARKVAAQTLPVTLSTWQTAVLRFRRNPLSLMGLIIIVGFILVALLAPVLAPPLANTRDPYMMPHAGYSPDPQAPRPGHPFGTTEQAFDIYYGIVWGARTAFRIGLMVVAMSVAIGIVVGGIAGFYRGKVDEVLMRIVDIFLAFPGLILAVVVVAILGPSLQNVLIALALVGWPGYARLLRGEVLSLRGRHLGGAGGAARAWGGPSGAPPSPTAWTPAGAVLPSQFPGGVLSAARGSRSRAQRLNAQGEPGTPAADPFKFEPVAGGLQSRHPLECRVERHLRGRSIILQPLAVVGCVPR